MSPSDAAAIAGHQDEGPSLRAILRVVLTVVASVLALYLIYLLRQPVGWLLLAAFLALAVSAPVNLLSRHLRRGFAIAIVYLLIILAPFGMLALFVPPIVEQGKNLANNAPKYAQDVTKFIDKNKTLNKVNKKYDITGKIQQEAAKLPSKIGDAASILGNVGSSIVSSIFAGLTILTLSIFMVGGAPRWREALIRSQPPRRAEALGRAATHVERAIGSYVRGALLQALIAGLSSWIVLLILDVPYAAPLAVVIFLLDLVPLVGATLGAIIVGVVTLFANFPTSTIIWVIWSVVYQQVENNVIQPRIQSRAVQIEPFVVLVAVLFGAALVGIVGALVAIPVAAAIQVVVREFIDYRRALAQDKVAAVRS